MRWAASVKDYVDVVGDVHRVLYSGQGREPCDGWKKVLSKGKSRVDRAKRGNSLVLVQNLRDFGFTFSGKPGRMKPETKYPLNRAGVRGREKSVKEASVCEIKSEILFHKLSSYNLGDFNSKRRA